MNSTGLFDWILAFELWWVSLTLLASAFVAWFEVHRGFSKASKELAKKRQEKARTELTKIVQDARKEGIEKSEDRILGMREFYEAADEPNIVFNNAHEMFLFSTLIFLLSVLLKAGVESHLLPREFLFWEGIVFLMGLFGLVTAIVYARRLMKMVHQESDPATRNVLQALPAIVIGALYTYMLWYLVVSIGLVGLTLFGKGLALSIIPTYVGIGSFLFGETRRARSRVVIVLLMLFPMLYILAGLIAITVGVM